MGAVAVWLSFGSIVGAVAVAGYLTAAAAVWRRHNLAYACALTVAIILTILTVGAVVADRSVRTLAVSAGLLTLVAATVIPLRSQAVRAWIASPEPVPPLSQGMVGLLVVVVMAVATVVFVRFTGGITF